MLAPNAGTRGEEKRLINGAPEPRSPPPFPAEGGGAETQIKTEEEGRFSRNQRRGERPSSLLLLFLILPSRRAARKIKITFVSLIVIVGPLTPRVENGIV